MNFTKTMLALAVGSVGIMGAMSAHAVDFNNGDALSITAGAQVLDEYGNATGVVTGSWFAMDTDGNSKIASGEKVVISQGTTGIVIGAPNTALGAITSDWGFFSNIGTNYVTTAITGGTGGLDMSGWYVNWSGIDIPMVTGAWQVINANSGMPTSGYVNGVAQLTWDGSYFDGTSGGAYTLNYTATVPVNDPSGFGGVQYGLHIEGVAVAAVPEASTYGMMLAGLGLVGFAVRRRKLV